MGFDLSSKECARSSWTTDELSSCRPVFALPCGPRRFLSRILTAVVAERGQYFQTCASILAHPSSLHQPDQAQQSKSGEEDEAQQSS